MSTIKHIWFDMDGTLIIQTPEFHEAHNDLRYTTYAEAVGKPLTEELQKEFESLYKEKGTNSGAFISLGFPHDYWQARFNTLDETKFYKPDQKVIATLETLKGILPISLFSNSKLNRVLRSLDVIGINPHWFTNIISGDDIREPKPALEGFLLMVEKSGLPPSENLYIGDRVEAEIVPAHAVGAQTALMWSESDRADYSLKSFEEILELIKT